MAEVIWTIKAYEHIAEIGSFIERDSSFQARRVIQAIIKETRKLKENIRIGHIIPEINEDMYRELKVYSYRILYKILGNDTIAIIGVVHGKKLFDPKWLD